MANEWYSNANTFYLDTASTAGTAASFINEKDVLVEGILLAADANSAFVVADLRQTNGTFGPGDEKLHLHCTAHSTEHIDLADTPIRFPNGIWLSSMTSGAKITFILRRKG